MAVRAGGAGAVAEMRVTSSTVRALLLRAGGIGPVPRRRARLRLSLTEREEISRGLAAGWSLRATGVWHEFECTVTAVADAIDGSPMDSTVVKVGVSDDGTSYA